MRFTVIAFLIALLWMSTLASNSGEGSASEESGEAGSSDKPKGDGNGGNQSPSNDGQNQQSDGNGNNQPPSNDGQNPQGDVSGNNQPQSNNGPNEHINRHIVNGRPAEENEVPFQCLLLYQGMLCGCAIISPNWVVTAAHCVTPESNLGAMVAAGITLLESVHDPGQSVVRFVPNTGIIVHPGYNQSNILSSDLALLSINPPFPIQDSIKPIPLMTEAYVPHRLSWKKVIATGWGLSEYSGGNPSAVLMGGAMLVVPNRLCSRLYRYNMSKILCTVSAPSTICAGDSGGPVFMEGANGLPMLVGTVSFGDQNCSIYNPAGHTYIGAYRSWIQKITGI